MSATQRNIHCSLLAKDGHERRPAIITAEGTPISYGQLTELSARYAGALAEAGLQPGDRLIALTRKSVRAVALYLATLQLGAIYVPLNPGFTRAEVTYFVDDAGPAMVVCDPERAEELIDIWAGSDVRLWTLHEEGTGTLDGAADRSQPREEVCIRGDDDIAAILYTSGTTGRAKGAMLSHGNLVTNARALQSSWGYRADDVLVHALPIFHTHGLFVAINLTLLSGAAVILLPRFDPAAVAERLPDATVLMGVPTYYTRLLALPDLRHACRDIRLFVSGSAPLAASTHLDWQEQTGHVILERYGMTETTMLTSNPLDGDRRAGTVGTPLPGVSLRIQDADEHGIGMVEVSGPNVFQGYWRMPDKTAEEFTEDGFFRTGDLGRFDEAGYLQIVGREKDLVISGGYNVYPKEVETVIDALDDVLESAVFGVADADVGERVVAAVVPRHADLLDRAWLERHVAERLVRYKRPSEYVVLDELPRNAMGKVQKNVLRERHGSSDAALTVDRLGTA